jgi:hypothetical protein
VFFGFVGGGGGGGVRANSDDSKGGVVSFLFFLLNCFQVNTENAEDEIREAFKVFDGVSITNLLKISMTDLLTVFYFYVLVYFVCR